MVQKPIFLRTLRCAHRFREVVCVACVRRMTPLPTVKGIVDLENRGSSNANDCANAVAVPHVANVQVTSPKRHFSNIIEEQ
jgi:hypothetical protein